MRTPLPIDPAIPELLASLAKKKSLVLSAAPGAGKTTRLPPALLSLTHKKILVLEPRRIAAIAASQRIAEENGWQLGKEVGYQVRFDARASADTRLLFLTEALLLRKLLHDPELRDVGCVVLDEFHERSLHVDLALAALKELQELARPDLKIVVMSATLNTEPLERYLEHATVADVPGKIFPLEIRYDEKPQIIRTGPDFTERMRKLVVKAMAENPEGDLLCFLPGRGEIERMRGELAEWAQNKNIAIFALHGTLELQEQKAALQPLPGRRKIILATNVAESSLTVEGVRIVVDSGLARISQLHPRTGFESLDLVRIPKASATQRAGRAARRGPGVVYRAWMPYDELSMKEFEPAEIFRTDLSETILLLSALGVTNVESFSWFEPPPARSLEQARGFLTAIGALAPNGTLTPLGAQLRELPVHPRLAKLLLAGRERGLTRFAAELAALLSEPSVRATSQYQEAENDLWVRWEDWQRAPGNGRYRTVARAAEQLRNLLRGDNERNLSRSELEHAMPELLLAAFADRLARRRRANEPQAKMVGGRGVKLHPDSSVRNSEFFVAIDLAEGRDAAETLVYQAVGVPSTLIQEKILPKAEVAKHLEWDDDKHRFWVTETKEWNGLSIAGEHRRPATNDEVEGQLADVLLERWERVLAGNEALARWFDRLKHLQKMDAKWALPAEEQIREALSQASYGENSLAGVAEKDLVPFFEQLLPAEQRDALQRECPAYLTVPTGNRLPIKYSDEQGPQLEVRLQELFGLKAAPLVGGQALTLVLLAPNYRPVQVTRDLASFWKNGYPEVRKEMRARYPKHSWPDDPLTAAPQSKGRPRIT